MSGTFSPSIASSTLLSVTNTFYAGGTATTTIDSAGNLSVIGNATTTGQQRVTGHFNVNGNATTTSAGNISTQGTLTVTGASSLSSTLAVTDVSTFTGRADLNGQASTTRLSVFDTLYVGGTSTTTITGNNTASTIAYASTTAITVSGTASTSVMIVGGNSTNGTLAGLIFGTCDLQQSSITASTTRGVQCTTATGISTAYKVFVMATSSLTGTLGAVPASNGFIIVSASSTAANVIGVELSNLTGAAATPAGTLNFWAVR